MKNVSNVASRTQAEKNVISPSHPPNPPPHPRRPPQRNSCVHHQKRYIIKNKKCARLHVRFSTRWQKQLDCTPRGGVVAESWVLSFFLGGCIVIAEMPSRNCRWLQNCDIAIADVPSRNCQCMCKRTVKKHTLRVSPSVF